MRSSHGKSRSSQRPRAAGARPLAFFALAVGVPLGLAAESAPARAAPALEELGSAEAPERPLAERTLEDVSPRLELLARRRGADDDDLEGAEAPTRPESPRAPPLAVSAALGVAELAAGRRAVTGLLLVTVPLGRIARGGGAARPLSFHIPRDVALEGALAEARPPEEPGDARAERRSRLASDTSDAPPGEAAPEAPALVVVSVSPELARAVARAALRHAGAAVSRRRLDSLAARAKSSALLPDLRLRATRLVDEAQSLAPTAYDPERVTARGGASLWLEARATWRLDRLVFADEEIAVERLRATHRGAEAKLVREALGHLFGWQRARALRADPSRSAETRARAVLAEVEAEASLDVLTGGWFSRWREEVGVP